MESEALIHAVEKRRCLYNKGDQNYCNGAMISAEWKTVAIEVGCNEDEAKKRWKTLRDYFLKVSRESQKSGSAGGVKRKWFLFDRMLFLKSCSSDRKTTTNIATPAPDNDTAIDEEELPPLSPSSLPSLASGSRATSPSDSGAIVDTGAAVLSLEDQNQDEELETPIKKFRPKSTTPRTHKNPFLQQRRSVGDFEAELLEAAKRKRPKEEKELSEEEHFFKNLVPKLQLMDPIDRMECQTEIQMVVLKYMKKVQARVLVETVIATCILNHYNHLQLLTQVLIIYQDINTIQTTLQKPPAIFLPTNVILSIANPQIAEK